MKAVLFACLILAGALPAAEPAEPVVIPIEPGKTAEEATASEAQTVYGQPPVPLLRNVTSPTLTAYLPDPANATGAAVIVAPGGAYIMLAIRHEGTDVARWLTARGIAAFVLRYRVAPMPETDDRGCRAITGSRRFMRGSARRVC